VICTLRRVKIILGVCQVSSVLFALLIMVSHQHSNIYNKIAYSYVWPISDVVFLTVAVGTYSYFFMKIKGNRKKVGQISRRIVVTKGRKESPTIYETRFPRTHLRRNSSMKSFFMPGVLICTFLVFIVIPDETVFWHQVLNIEINEKVNSVMLMLYKFEYLSDAIVYIFLQKEIFSRAKIILFRNINRSIAS